jgi:hypothetical protein
VITEAGEYVVRGMDMEYRMEGAWHTYNLQAGEAHTLTITAIKTSFSCFGRVTYINDVPAANVSVVALPASQHGDKRAATTDASGRFRIRALKVYLIYL